MNAKFLEAITAACRESEIDLSLRDIVSLKETEGDLVMHVRNDQEMFEFKIFASIIENTIVQMFMSEVEGSPYSADNCLISYNLKDKTIQFQY